MPIPLVFAGVAAASAAAPFVYDKKLREKYITSAKKMLNAGANVFNIDPIFDSQEYRDDHTDDENNS